MKRLMFLSTTLLLLIIADANADEVMPLGVEGIKRAAISILIGGGLEETSRTEFLLFGSNVARSKRFEASLLDSITKRLNKAGITIDQTSHSGFGVAFFGRPVNAKSCENRYAVYISFAVYNERYGIEPIAESSLIEIPTDQNLEKELERGTLLLLEEALGIKRSE
jgi:hypothetical protein